MRILPIYLLAAITLPAAVASSPGIAWSQPAASQNGTEAARFLADLGRFYDTADGPVLANDAAGRLRIYREVVNRMDAAAPAIRATPAWQRMHLFYSVAVAVTLADAGERAAGVREVDRLLPLVREFVSDNPRDLTLVEAFSRLLRSKGQFAQTARDTRTALQFFREVVPLTEALVAADTFPDRDYGDRSLAIDLDNLAYQEAQAGNRPEADRASARALQLFRTLAARSPDNRPAQGSLLIALLRRAMNFNEMDRLEEAERQLAVMRGRGQLIDRYAGVAAQIPAIRAQIVRATSR